MKALLLHCKDYRIAVGQLANRPENIHPEPVTENTQEQSNCVLVLATVESGDTTETIDPLIDEIKKMAKDVGRNDIVILPFAHLSNDLANSESAISILENIKDRLSGEFNVKRSHFGSHKAFMFDVYGHPGNARFRAY